MDFFAGRWLRIIGESQNSGRILLCTLMAFCTSSFILHLLLTFGTYRNNMSRRQPANSAWAPCFTSMISKSQPHRRVAGASRTEVGFLPLPLRDTSLTPDMQPSHTPRRADDHWSSLGAALVTDRRNSSFGLTTEPVL